ncbi:MAG: hypothetical protein RLO80_07880 [Hyphomonas sp.]
MVRPQIQILSALLLSFCLASCGKARQNNNEEPAASTSELIDVDANKGAPPPESQTCSQAFLLERADAFHRAAQAGQVAYAISFYESKEAAYLFQIQFGTASDGEAIFQFSPGTDYTTLPISPYHEAGGPVGELVAYVETSSVSAMTDVAFLESEIRSKFFACHWICRDGQWKVSSRHSCFEETDGPFGIDYDQ